MTPEQIALEHGLCTCDPIYTSRGMKAPDCPWHAYEVEAAMEAYGRQEVLLMAKFVDEHKYYRHSGLWYKSEHDDLGPITDDQLYDLYLTYKNSQI